MDACTVLQFAVAPATFMLLFLFLKSKYLHGDFSLFFRVYLIGLLSVALILVADRLIRLAGLDNLHSFHRTLFYAFILTAGLFQLVIFAIMRIFVYRNRRFVNVSDGIVYALAVSLGFATSYAVYVYFAKPAFIDPCTYAWSSGPAVTCFATMMGFFFGMARNRRNSFIDLLTGLGAAIILNGVYRFCLLYQDKTMLLLSLIAMTIIALVLIVKAIRSGEQSA